MDIDIKSSKTPWYEHPYTSKILVEDKQQNALMYLNEAKQIYKKYYYDINERSSPIDAIIDKWPSKSKTEKQYIMKTLENGPVNTKIGTMGLVVVEFPMYSIYFLDSLISYVSIKQKRFAYVAIDVLGKLFSKFLLPVKRSLFNIKDRPLDSLETIGKSNKANKKIKNGEIPLKEKVLCFWYFEEHLKTRYNRFLKAVEEMLNNEHDKANKVNMLKVLMHLLENVENQTLLFDILVNKLGDTENKVSGTCLTKLIEYVNQNSSKMPILVRAVRKFVFRPNLAHRSQLYCMQLLSQLYLSSKKHSVTHDDFEGSKPESVALELIHIYVGVFKRLYEDKNSVDDYQNLYSVILRGISRCLPYANDIDIQNYLDLFFKLAHSDNLTLTCQAVKVLFLMVSKRKSKKIVEGSSNVNLDRFQRLIFSILMNPNLLSHRNTEELVEIVLKSLVIDMDRIRVKAILKRLLQLCLVAVEPGFVAGVLLMMSHLLRVESMRQCFMMNQGKMKRVDIEEIKMPHLGGPRSAADEDDDNEVLEDAETYGEIPCEDPVLLLNKKEATHYKEVRIYDGLGRDPKYCNADKCDLVELLGLARHYHPTVRHFANSILRLEPIEYETDPSVDLSLMRFLERFNQKNPKKQKVVAALGPASKTNGEVNKTKELNVFGEEFQALPESQVPTDLAFFHLYANLNKKNKDIEDEVGDNVSDIDVDDENVDVDEDDDFSGLSDDDGELGSLLDGDDDSEVEVEDDDDAGVGMDDEDDDVEVGTDNDDDDEADLDGDDDDVSMDDDDDDEEDEKDDEVSLHSSKKKRLGTELSSITLDTMRLSREMQKIKERVDSKIHHDRKNRKRNKPRKENLKFRNKKQQKNKSRR